MSNAHRDWQSDEIHELTQQLGDRDRIISELEDRVCDLEAVIEQQDALFKQPDNAT